MRMTVYGVFVKDRCVYVGCSSNFELRKATHLQRFGKLFDVAPQVRPLKEVALPDASEVERSMIRLYKDLGQAEFNSNPSVYHRLLKPSRSERQQEILSLKQLGFRNVDIAQRLNVSQAMVSNVCRANGIFSIPGRKAGTGVGYGIKITRAQYEEILRRDERNIPHADIGKLFGISRERVRQICDAAGRPTRRERQREEMGAREQRRRSDLAAKRQLRRVTPTPNTLRISGLWSEGKTIREIGALMGVKPNSMAVWLIRCRNRFPALFPYRRAEHLRWKGKNFRMLKRERELKAAA